MSVSRSPMPHKVNRWRSWVLGAAAVFIVVAVLGAGLVMRGAGSPGEAGASPPASSAGGGRSADGTGSPGAPAPVTSDAAPDPEASPSPTGPPATGGTEVVEKPAGGKEHSFDDTAPVASQLVVEVTSVEAVTAGRDIPGEISGPAVKVEIQVENIGTSAVDTSGASVNLTYGDDDLLPAASVMDGASVMLPGSLAPGATAVASYTFAVPLEDDRNVRIMVDILADEPDVVFNGPRP